ncbi:MAG: ATP-binding protein, partial [bacterium]|nr:ATP-binding protein [bacterium]
GFTRLVLRRSGDALPERQRENLEKVKASADHLLSLINDILDLSKIEAGRMDIHPERFVVKTLVDGCCATVSPLVKSGVGLRCEVANGLAEVETDQARVRQIVINLLSNAAKFTETGEIVLKADLEQQGGNWSLLKITVADTGIGIPGEKLEAIFEEFEQVDGAHARERQGTGLGLSITKKLVGLLGGTVFVESEEGKGSVFTVRIPAVYR